MAPCSFYDSSDAASRLSNRIVYGGLHCSARWLPLPILHGISLLGNTLAVTFMRETLEAIRENFRLALGVPEREARRLARRLVFEREDEFDCCVTDLGLRAARERIRDGSERVGPGLPAARDRETAGEPARFNRRGMRILLTSSSHFWFVKTLKSRSSKVSRCALAIAWDSD